jgi:hypothetical protein
MTETDPIDTQEYEGDIVAEREAEKLILVPDDPGKVPPEGDDTANHNRSGGGD